MQYSICVVFLRNSGTFRRPDAFMGDVDLLFARFEDLEQS